MCAALAARGERVAAFKPVVTGLDEPAGRRAGRATTSCSPARRAPGRRPDDVAPLTFGPPVSPHYAAELAGATIEPPSSPPPRARPASAPTCSSCEGVGGLLVPLTPGYLIRDLALDLGLPLVVAARPGARHDQPHAAHARGRARRGPRVAGVVITPWPDEPAAIERSNRDTIEPLGESACRVLPHDDARRPGRRRGGACRSTTGWRRLNLRTFLPPPATAVADPPALGDAAPPLLGEPRRRPRRRRLPAPHGLPVRGVHGGRAARGRKDHPDVAWIAVSHASPEATDDWSHDIGGTTGVRVVVDPERSAYAAWGLGRSTPRPLRRPALARPGREARPRGRQQPPPRRDALAAGRHLRRRRRRQDRLASPAGARRRPAGPGRGVRVPTRPLTGQASSWRASWPTN